MLHTNKVEVFCRSRYTAYTTELVDYIADTTHPDAGEFTGSRAKYKTSIRDTARRLVFKKLEIVSEEAGSSPDEYFITFNCKYVEKRDKKQELTTRREKSRFIRSKGQWWFADAELEEKKNNAASGFIDWTASV